MEYATIRKEFTRYNKTWVIYKPTKKEYKKYYLQCKTKKSGFWTFSGWFNTIREINKYIQENEHYFNY